LLKELETDAGTITGQTNLAHYVRNFYERLYTSEAHAPSTTEAREECWFNTPTRVSAKMNDELVRDLTLKEILDAIAAMPRNKAPGSDGIPTKFFQELAEEIAPTLLKTFTAMLKLRETSMAINKGLLTLIPKSGDHARLSNWRPITLLGSLHKILAKTLARKLHGILPSIVKPN